MNKTIIEINSNNYASTGNIMLGIANEARKNNYDVYTCCKRSRFSLKRNYDNQIYIGIWLERIISERLSIITGLKGHFNLIGTKVFLNKINKLNPNLIHLHSLVDTYININMLFKYIKKHNIPVVWTFHDPWAFTGQCIVYDTINCTKWKNGCNHCELLHKYPSSLLFDFSNFLWNEKKNSYSSYNNMTIITPSKWLENETKKSFLSNSSVKTINNAIDFNIFIPMESSFRVDNNLENKYIILGIAYEWTYYKGLDVFNRLANDLSDNYKIVLIGVNEKDKENINDKILSIEKTYNQIELAKIYSAADLFANPTRADNFPTVNIESLACGTPVLTFNTGGSPEAIDETCGSVVEKDDYDSFLKEIIRICETKPYTKENCLIRSKQFAVEEKYKEYIELFNDILR